MFPSKPYNFCLKRFSQKCLVFERKAVDGWSEIPCICAKIKARCTVDIAVSANIIFDQYSASSIGARSFRAKWALQRFNFGATRSTIPRFLTHQNRNCGYPLAPTFWKHLATSNHRRAHAARLKDPTILRYLSQSTFEFHVSPRPTEISRIYETTT